INAGEKIKSGSYFVAVPYAAPASAMGAFSLIASGNNFAVGGARVSLQPGNLSQYPTLQPTIPSVQMQVNDFLARGLVDSKALYALLGGSNDIFYQAATNPAGAPAAVVTAANDFVAQVARLQNAGVRNMIVIGLPDIGKTPEGQSQGLAAATFLSQLTATYDATQAAGLAGKNLLYFDGNKLFTAIFANPLAYGFTNTTVPKCGWPPAAALGCAAAADGYMFADVVHWSTSLHKVVSDWIYSSLEGASRVGLLSQVPMGRSGAQWRSIDGRLREFQNFGYQGQGFFVTGDYASSDKDAYAGLPSANGSGGSFVLGYEKAFSDQLFAGATLGYGNAPFDLGNNLGTVKYDEWALSAFVSHKSGNFYVNALTTYLWLDYESKRNIQLGPFSTSERGDTRGGQFGVKGQIGYNFFAGNLLHGPLAGLAWEQVKVDGFSEKSTSATAMTFGEQTRESLRSRLGWQVAAETVWSGAKVRPYAQLTYDYEHKKDERTYSAGFVGGNNALLMPTSNQTGGYGTLLAGATAELSKTLRLGVGASTTISQPGQRNSAINVTLSAPL
ncbi:autotransporter outer membrane beta-barrel domain-containing protein, partial [Propionivibrio sp.]|uniref:autotransporter outer membrane beta-barrel domain-containing protein n=1 Tax=Propionivibrio sp. TaxID=2212460 RepID=UPI003BF29F12